MSKQLYILHSFLASIVRLLENHGLARIVWEGLLFPAIMRHAFVALYVCCEDKGQRTVSLCCFMMACLCFCFFLKFSVHVCMKFIYVCIKYL